MNERKVFELAISLFSFLKTNEKKIIFESFKTPDEIFSLSTKDLSFVIGRSLRVAELKSDSLKCKLEKALKIIKTYKINLVSIYDEDYPEELRKIKEPPFAVFYRGEKIKQGKKIAIVGTRRPTGYGMQFTFDTAKKFSEKNFIVVSGMAIGVDAFAHKGAVSIDAPTIAVLACSVENLYPRMNAGLAGKILDKGGTIVSEYPPMSEPLKYRFLERNRIVSALSDATVVIEAPEKSGALSTAKHALEQGKWVFIFEQVFDSPQNRGGQTLDAEIINSVDDVIEIINNKKERLEQNLLFDCGDKR